MIFLDKSIYNNILLKNQNKFCNVRTCFCSIPTLKIDQYYMKEIFFFSVLSKYFENIYTHPYVF